MTPSAMTPVQTLLLVWATGSVLSRNGDRLHVDAPKGKMPPELLEVLRTNKAELLAILPAHRPLDRLIEKRGIAK